MTDTAVEHSYEILRAATPVIRIHGIGGRRWKRNVARVARIGPWLRAKYEIENTRVWDARNPCLHLVTGSDEVIRYVGISRNRLKNRWRVSPAYEAETVVRLPGNQLFHSQCWKHIERETAARSGTSYEFRCIDGQALLPVMRRLGPPLAAFESLAGDGEGIVAGVERWMCNNRGRGWFRGMWR